MFKFCCVIVLILTMNCYDRKRIHVNWSKLVENLMVNGVCDQLMVDDIIDDEEYEEITALPKTQKARVRTLLRTLIAKDRPDVLDVFCNALVKADPIYEYLADSIRDADVSSVADADVVDAGNDAPHKQDAMVKTILRQSDELMRLNEEYRRQIAELSQRNEILERRQSCITALESTGFTEKSLLQFVDVFVLAKNVGQNGAPVGNAGENLPYPDILQKMPSEMLSRDQLKACLLGIYIVQHVVTENCQYQLPDSLRSYSARMSDIVDSEMRAYPNLFDNAIRRLHIIEINGLNTFDAVADGLFDDGECNWGRVIAWFAFCAAVAKKFPDSTAPDTLHFYAIFCWFYINNRMCDWIEKAGGWVCMFLVFRRNHY